MDHAPSSIPALHCPACGYDVSTSINDGMTICPECGSSTQDDAIARFAARSLRRWTAIGCFGLLVVAFAAGMALFLSNPSYYGMDAWWLPSFDFVSIACVVIFFGGPPLAVASVVGRGIALKVNPDWILLAVVVTFFGGFAGVLVGGIAGFHVLRPFLWG